MLNEVAENVKYLGYTDENDEPQSAINLDYLDNLYDSSSQSCDNSNNINSNIPINLEHTVIKDNTQDTFINRLRSWAVSYKIPHNALGSLLKLLQIIPTINLPLDPRTLLCIPRHIFSKSVAPGIYSHIGIQNAYIYIHI